MITKQSVLDRLNEIIEEEKGRPVTLNDMFMDSKLDSLGATITLVTLDGDYGFFGDVEEGDELVGVETLTVRDLVKKCILASTGTSEEP